VGISKLPVTEIMPKRLQIGLTLLALYIPYCWLWPSVEGNWTWVQIWPLLPGIGTCSVIPWVPSGLDFPLLVTALLLGISVFGAVKLRKAFWAMIAGLLALSFASSWMVYLLMKA